MNDIGSSSPRPRAALYVYGTPTDPYGQLQLRGLREASARQNWVVAAEYVDPWSPSRGGAGRPSLGQLRRDARAGNLDLVCVSNLDRWGSDIRSCHALLREWLAGGRRFVALQEKLDLERLWDGSSPMVLALLAAAAEFELRAHQRRRIRRRAAQRRRAAKPVNRARLWQLHLSGASVREMAAELGQSRSTVHRTLQSMRSSLR